MDLLPFKNNIDKLKKTLLEIKEQSSHPNFYKDQKKSTALLKENQRIMEVIETYEKLLSLEKYIQENKSLVEEEKDEEMIELAKEEISSMEKEISTLHLKFKSFIIPTHISDSKNCIIEIRPATGGDEAALFVEDLYKMYTQYALKRYWKINVIELHSNDLGGLKNVTFSLKGKNVYKEMKFESGVHRVQRIPVTESQGRVHTSTVTVAVLPEADEVDIVIKDEDLRIDTYRASGAGGQHVNTTDSAVRITHIPSNTVVTSQAERSQHKNKEAGLKVLRAKIMEQQEREFNKKISSERREQVGTGERNERIRTYNFPQNRVTDHRYNLTFYDLTNILAGEIFSLFEKILIIDLERKLTNFLEK